MTLSDSLLTPCNGQRYPTQGNATPLGNTQRKGPSVKKNLMGQ